jgi:hypothetical protein
LLLLLLVVIEMTHFFLALSFIFLCLFGCRGLLLFFVPFEIAKVGTEARLLRLWVWRRLG